MSGFKLAALIGPTACGKSDLSIAVAEQTGCEILSCDSLLIYKHLNIGTAKPTSTEMKSIPHHGMDLVEPDQTFNAGDYVRYATALIEELKAKQKKLLIVGGTGFYLKALLCGVWDAPPTQKDFRENLESEFSNLTEEEKKLRLHALLQKQDPDYASKIPAGDSYRVIRALEIIHVTKKTMAQVLAEQQNQNALPYPCPVFGIKRFKRELERRIIERTNKMFQNGIVEETKRLIEKYPSTPRPLLSVGYKEVLDFLNGKMTLPECRERIVISTRQLAKKQMTFFNTFPKPIDWNELPTQTEKLTHDIIKVLM